MTGKEVHRARAITELEAACGLKDWNPSHFLDTRRGTVLIEDEITAPAGDVVWRAFTDADAEIIGDRVILRKDGKQISLRRVSKTGAWSLVDAKPPTAAEKQNEGFRAIVLTAPKAKRVALAVEIVP